jgi:hypothetical protein
MTDLLSRDLLVRFRQFEEQLAALSRHVKQLNDRVACLDPNGPTAFELGKYGRAWASTPDLVRKYPQLEELAQSWVTAQPNPQQLAELSPTGVVTAFLRDIRVPHNKVQKGKFEVTRFDEDLVIQRLEEMSSVNS